MTNEVLIADDQPGIQLLLTDILENDGYVITTASTGKEAIDRLKEKHYALIILDYKLPIMDGIEVLKKMGASQVKTPAIVMSGLAESIEKELQHYPQVKKLLAKPFNVKDVSKTVKNIIEQS